MSSGVVGTFAREAAVGVEKVGRQLIDAGLGAGGSLLTPGESIWTTDHLDELIEKYVDSPDVGDGDFSTKLEGQLAGSSPAAIQLFGEMVILNVLPTTNVGGTLKVKQVNSTLSISQYPVTLPADVEDALSSGGVFNGGQAFTSYRWAQLKYLIQFAHHFKSLPQQRQADALVKPLIFREEALAVQTGQAAQRQSLLYLAFPHFYLPVVSVNDRRKLRDGLADTYLASPTDDLDQDLAQIYAEIMRVEGGHVDLYAEPWKSRWDKQSGPPPEPPGFPPTPPRSSHLPDASNDLAARLHVDIDWLQDCIELLRERRQLIFYGPPGTGKTYIAQALARHIAGEANVKLVQFHPAYSYEDFFEGFRPQEGSGGQVGFRLKPGPLRSLVTQAAERPDAAYVLVIDEINRGNLAKIFGELYFLLEYRDHSIDLMYSSEGSEPFSLPANIYVIGTMNTVDRSIALVDTALRRRFAFVSLHPSAEPTSGVLRRWLASNGYPTELADLHSLLNRRIADAEFKIGPSYFMRDRIASDSTGRALELMWRTDLMPLLEEHHYGDRNIDVSVRYGLEGIRREVAASVVDEAGSSLTAEMDEADAGNAGAD